ncbi:hypothetical protein LA080_009632 [Diaporthe eres]|nr:hypothetical protein LA080_009632 [Diaporthe eres]
MFDTPFWTDRLCSDQNDHDEVPQQVLLMGEIYSKANRSVVWLNISDYDLESILQALKWSEGIDRDKKAFQCQRLRMIGRHQRRLYSDPIEKTFRLAIRRLSVNDYWLCFWIVQEVVKANHVEIMTERFSWNAAHVLLDAILESSPPLTQFGYKTTSLLGGQLRTYNSLQEYIKSSRTSQRHSGFARLTRHVWDVVEAMITVLGDVEKTDLEQAAVGLFRNDEGEPTLHQNGAVMGLVFASNAGRQPPQNSHAKLEVASAWRCAAHMHRISNEEKRKRTVARVADLYSKWYSWDTQLAATVCAEKSESCDFSTMVFDIPHVGFRLLLETDMNGCLEARWRLQLDKMKTKGAVAANVQKLEGKAT